MCHSQICLLWRSAGVSGLAHRLEPKAIFLQAPQSSERIHGQATGGPHGLPSFPSQRHTEDPVLDISALEPKMSCLSTLCGKHHHPPPHPRPHPPRKHAPRCDETGKQWSGKQKGINIPPRSITAAEAACGRRHTSIHRGGDKEQPGSSEGRRATALRRRCIPCLGTCRQCRHPVTS